MTADYFADNILSTIQIVLFLCAAFWLVRKIHSMTVYLLAAGYLCLALGNVFMVLFIFLRGEYPPYFSAQEVAWLGSFIFFIAAHSTISKGGQKAPWYAWGIATVVASVFALLIVLYGDFLLNLLFAVPLAWLAWCAVCGLSRRSDEQLKLHPFYLALLTEIALLLAMYLTGGWLYVVFDALWMLLLLWMAVAFYKGVEPS